MYLGVYPESRRSSWDDSSVNREIDWRWIMQPVNRVLPSSSANALHKFLTHTYTHTHTHTHTNTDVIIKTYQWDGTTPHYTKITNTFKHIAVVKSLFAVCFDTV